MNKTKVKEWIIAPLIQCQACGHVQTVSCGHLLLFMDSQADECRKCKKARYFNLLVQEAEVLKEFAEV